MASKKTFNDNNNKMLLNLDFTKERFDVYNCVAFDAIIDIVVPIVLFQIFYVAQS